VKVYFLFTILILFLNLQCINIGNPSGIGPSGVLYSHYKIGYSENLLPEKADKQGKACTHRYFFFYVTGDSSLGTAARNGSITEIKSINKEVYNYFLIYSSLCSIVTGN